MEKLSKGEHGNMASGNGGGWFERLDVSGETVNFAFFRPSIRRAVCLAPTPGCSLNPILIP